LVVAARDIGIGDDPAMKLLVQISTTVTSGGAATLSVALQGAPDNGAGLEGTYVTWWTSPVYALATLVAGARLYDMDMPRPPAGVVIPRFIRLSYIIAGATTTAGNVSSYLVLDRHDISYQSTNNAVLAGTPLGSTSRTEGQGHETLPPLYRWIGLCIAALCGLALAQSITSSIQLSQDPVVHLE